MTFNQILGHDRQKEILLQALARNRLAHAYLFSGPDGIGKRLVALALTRAIVCHEQRGCGDCAACRKIDHHNHPDLHLLEASGSAIKIEDVRSIQRELNFRPLEASRKICLIDQADLMTASASNALLKTLEEPRGNALIILLTAHPNRLLETIRSRCQRLPFHRHPTSRIQNELERQLDLEPNEAHILAALAEGSFKKAFGKDRELFLDQRRQLLKTLTGLSAGSILPILEFAEHLAADKAVLPEILEIFQVFYQDVIRQLNGGTLHDFVNRDLQAKIERVACNESLPSVLTKLDSLFAAQRQLERNVNRQLAMEVLLLRLTA
ncbi:MAG: DNA polymerase III subunit delta' [Deltaproteobacteria bacterium]|jgi:DNA polymerase-3 subunit delta'|nr:DNA polymerase III subunit delta' [Deltaproteobacteria bacterium]